VDVLPAFVVVVVVGLSSVTMSETAESTRPSYDAVSPVAVQVFGTLASALATPTENLTSAFARHVESTGIALLMPLAWHVSLAAAFLPAAFTLVVSQALPGGVAGFTSPSMSLTRESTLLSIALASPVVRHSEGALASALATVTEYFTSALAMQVE